MSEEQKYYTPAPEEIRIGFEYLLYNPSAYNELVLITIEDIDSIEYALKRLKKELDGDVRVPYLTAEQIEAEGFPLMDVNTGFGRFKKGNIELWYSSLYTLTVMFDNDPIFRGYCRCVNDFRLICKMLSIETTKNNAI